jgi:hypothetical protein
MERKPGMAAEIGYQSEKAGSSIALPFSFAFDM